MKAHLKKGDEVVVLSGAERGKRGKVIAVNPKNSRAIVEGLKMIKRHTRKSQDRPQGAIVEREGTLHLSNLMKAELFDARAAKRAPGPGGFLRTHATREQLIFGYGNIRDCLK